MLSRDLRVVAPKRPRLLKCTCRIATVGYHRRKGVQRRTRAAFVWRRPRLGWWDQPDEALTRSWPAIRMRVALEGCRPRGRRALSRLPFAARRANPRTELRPGRTATLATKRFAFGVSNVRVDPTVLGAEVLSSAVRGARLRVKQPGYCAREG